MTWDSQLPRKGRNSREFLVKILLPKIKNWLRLGRYKSQVSLYKLDVWFRRFRYFPCTFEYISPRFKTTQSSICPKNHCKSLLASKHVTQDKLRTGHPSHYPSTPIPAFSCPPPHGHLFNISVQCSLGGASARARYLPALWHHACARRSLVVFAATPRLCALLGSAGGGRRASAGRSCLRLLLLLP